jgi:single-strand DNA-binding protein
MAVFGDLNQVELIGNITQDIEVKSTSNGNSVTNFSLATNRSYKVGEEWKEETNFHNIVVWGNDAEYLSQKARKGTRVFVSGRLQTRKWEDNDGKTNYRTEVIATRVILLDRYERGESDTSSVSNKAKQSQPESNENSINPDDLPF